MDDDSFVERVREVQYTLQLTSNLSESLLSAASPLRVMGVLEWLCNYKRSHVGLCPNTVH